jgi:hypothetical protein
MSSVLENGRLRDLGTSNQRSKNMGYSAQEMVDAILNVGALRGSDGRGKDGLDGYMSMLASTSYRRFGILLGRALRFKMTARRGTDDEESEFYTDEEAKANLRSVGIPLQILDYLTPVDLRNLPADRRKKAEPNGTRSITEAVINAAIRHGSDGRGKDGMRGYFLLLERMDPPIFDMLTRMAQSWQVKHPPPSPKRELDPRPEESISAILKEFLEERCGPDRDHIGKNPYEDPEVDDEGLIDATANTRAAE